MEVFMHTFFYLLSINTKCFMVYDDWMFAYNENVAPRQKLACMSLDKFYNFDPPSDLTSLGIIGTKSVNFVPLKEDFFARTSQLEDILIFKSVNKLEAGVFNPIQKKKGQIKFLENDIPVLQTNTFNLTGSFTLTLANNQIKQIEPGAFGNVEQIFLHENKITTIKKDVFTNLDLTLLNLASNQINFIENGTFFGMKKLKFLSLDNNKLGHFNIEKLFGETTNLEMLYLNQNPLLTIASDMFFLVPKLKLLGLNRISVKEISKNTFKSLESLEFLDLKQNKLEILDPDVFPDRNNLTYLFLNGNNLTFFAPNLLEKLKNIKTIAIYNNPLQCPCKDEFVKWADENDIGVFCQKNTNCFENSICDYSFKMDEKIEKVARIDKCQDAINYKQYLYHDFRTRIFG